MARQIQILSGVILDEQTWLDAGEICSLCRLSNAHLIELVEEGILQPVGSSPRDWSFPARDLARLRRALRLQRDLEVNLAGVALAMDLLDEMERLRARLRVLEGEYY